MKRGDVAAAARVLPVVFVAHDKSEVLFEAADVITRLGEQPRERRRIGAADRDKADDRQHQCEREGSHGTKELSSK